jgi:hypothetical protein
MTRRLRSIDAGDRCVVILLTTEPWRYTRHLRRWASDGWEPVVCSRLLGSGGALGVLGDPEHYNDALCLVVDRTGLAAMAGFTLGDSRPPDLPVVLVEPIDGWSDAVLQERRELLADVTACGWTGLLSPVSHTDPRPGQITAWCAGWWAGQEAKSERLSAPETGGEGESA